MDEDLEYDGTDVYTYAGDHIRCDNCGREMEWCDGCKMYSRTCCEEYGTCMCS